MFVAELIWEIIFGFFNPGSFFQQFYFCSTVPIFVFLFCFFFDHAFPFLLFVFIFNWYILFHFPIPLYVFLPPSSVLYQLFPPHFPLIRSASISLEKLDFLTLSHCLFDLVLVFHLLLRSPSDILSIYIHFRERYEMDSLSSKTQFNTLNTLVWRFLD